MESCWASCWTSHKKKETHKIFHLLTPFHRRTFNSTKSNQHFSVFTSLSPFVAFLSSIEAKRYQKLHQKERRKWEMFLKFSLLTFGGDFPPFFLVDSLLLYSIVVAFVWVEKEKVECSTNKSAELIRWIWFAKWRWRCTRWEWGRRL